jgi:hypothetical protein
MCEAQKAARAILDQHATELATTEPDCRLARMCGAIDVSLTFYLAVEREITLIRVGPEYELIPIYQYRYV